MDEDEIFEIILAYLPDTVEGWLALLFGACALVSLFVPAPPENCHPAWKIGHRLICIFGLGAGRLRSAGRLGKIGRLFRRKK